jgi:ubiquinol-cytochrome c reductase subunit 8
MGWWGNLGSQTQKNIITYSLAANRLNPTSHILSDAVFNTFRRTRNQILYWVPPLLAGYMLMDWATER